MLGEAFEQEGAGKKKQAGESGGGNGMLFVEC